VRPLLFIFGTHLRHGVVDDLIGDSPALKFVAQCPPAQAAVTMIGIHRRVGESGVIHETQLP
jgi:hypothetical protein